MRWPFLVVALLFLPLPTVGQDPDLGPFAKLADDAVGSVVVPALNTTYSVLGQNITREDVRIRLDVNVTKGDVSPLGLLLGSGNVEIQAEVLMHVEMRVISSDRIRAAVSGKNAISAENATALSELYLPAEVFRATLSAEAIALFQAEEEAALADYLAETLPELEVLSLDFRWSHVLPTDALTDTSLTEPPIVLDIAAVVQYLRVESIPSLLEGYFQDKPPAKEDEKAYVKRLKAENGDPLRARDFFSAAAYTQLLNLSMQPGWSLDVHIHLPRGYSIEYTNEAVQRHGDRSISFHVDALTEDHDKQEVLLASITHRRAVAFALFVATWVVAGMVAVPARFLYGKYRLPKMEKGPRS